MEGRKGEAFGGVGGGGFWRGGRGRPLEGREGEAFEGAGGGGFWRGGRGRLLEGYAEETSGDSWFHIHVVVKILQLCNTLPAC